MPGHAFTLRRAASIAGKVAAGMLAVPILYLLAALAGALVPANWGWQEPERGVTIFVQTNGVHTWIAMPKSTALMDWRPLMPAEHIEESQPGQDYVAVGYGNREFYLNTPAWKDLTAGRAVRAAVGNGPSLMHVYHERRPTPDEAQRPIVLTPVQYRRLVRFIEASFDRDRAGKTMPLIGRGYGRNDVFYEARGGYNLYYTCNEWAGDALREAGVRVGVWTPFSQAVMWRF